MALYFSLLCCIIEIYFIYHGLHCTVEWLCKQHHCVILERFHHPRKKLRALQEWICIPPAATNLLSFSLYLHVLNVSYYKKHVMCDLWLFSLRSCFQGSHMLCHELVLHSFS